MEQFKATLRRKVGPFTVGAWLLVVVAGVALGLMVKRAMGTAISPETSPNNAKSYEALDDALPATEGITQNSYNAADFTTLATDIRTENSRWRDELRAWAEATAKTLFTQTNQDAVEATPIPGIAPSVESWDLVAGHPGDPDLPITPTSPPTTPEWDLVAGHPGDPDR